MLFESRSSSSPRRLQLGFVRCICFEFTQPRPATALVVRLVDTKRSVFILAIRRLQVVRSERTEPVRDVLSRPLAHMRLVGQFDRMIV
ncbi:unnamed protein product [Protopolystoma xenopodis]|uniref:Uncharacterized protein n=1 Tax=Protopolystoma xenopodis TaxID=117903 RepID=A0A448XQ71_9PLAT|nr:unnamed protein product [Protopolystoma xenopodis]